MLFRLPALWRQFEARKFKSRRDRASNQRPVSRSFRSLPGVRRHDRLWRLAGGKIRPEPHAARAVAVRNPQGQCIAGMVVPYLDGIDAMPVRTLASGLQFVDRGGARTAVSVQNGIAKRLAIMAAFR